MDLKLISEEINEIIKKRQEELQLTFEEEHHTYRMMDIDGKIKSTFPSVSKLIKKFHPFFDSNAKALQMCKGDIKEQEKLLLEWKAAGDYSTNMGSRVHYLLETEIVDQYGNYKEVRQPIFNVEQSQIDKSDKMVEAGKKYIDLMHERGAVLLDTEMILGDPILGYTGQPDKGWLMINKEQTDIGFIITDWKSNKPEKFVSQWYTKKLYPPFQKYDDTPLGHYYCQLPLYARLLLKMLEGSKYKNLKLLGCIVVLVKDDGTFEEFRVPSDINQTILTMDLTKYTKR